MSISDVFKSLATGFSVAGRVEAGFVMREDRVLCQPLNQLCTVKGVLVEQADSQTG
jgi:translation elongation factor EF-1alpha